jgi:hypothetical protein
MLYVMTERWPLARKYRDVFERIKESVLDILEKGKYQTRQHIPGSVLGLDLTAGLEEGILGSASQDFDQMIGEITGGSFDMGARLIWRLFKISIFKESVLETIGHL